MNTLNENIYCKIFSFFGYDSYLLLLINKNIYFHLDKELSRLKLSKNTSKILVFSILENACDYSKLRDTQNFIKCKDVFMYLYENNYPKDDIALQKLAYDYNNYGFLKYFIRKKHHINPMSIYIASKYNDLRYIRFLYENKINFDQEKVVETAVLNGNIKILRYADKKQFSLPSNIYYKFDDYDVLLECIKYIRNNNLLISLFDDYDLAEMAYESCYY